ncbi:MAG TPA: matrixin family metalloprotease [Planctomycetota bacterium]|nr:matrixin family metalloprotease [Planctomycetota bacterium]
MKVPRRSLFLLAVAAALAFPSVVPGYSLLGGDLPVAHRGFVVFPASFTDPTANENLAADPNFPGATGATLAVWKAAVEWGSYRHGPAGAGDSTQGALGGDPGNTASVDNPLANFDYTYQGPATPGVAGKFVAGSSTSLGPGILAVTYPGYDWQIFFDDAQWTWDDGPGGGIGGFDIQGVAAHELGHALGLGHSADGNATMYPAVLGNGVADRSIATDDGDGAKAIYGMADSAKPRITGVSGAASAGGTITIDGANFAPSGNEVWFTSSASNAIPRVVGALASTGGGTAIAVAVPTLAPVPASGDVLVKVPGAGGSSLSNAWPVAVAPPAAPSLASVAPPTVPVSGVPTPTITLSGSSLGPVTFLNVGGLPIPSSIFASAGDAQISVLLPPGLALGPAAVTATSPGGTSNALVLDVAPADPPVLLVPSLTASYATLVAQTFTVPGRLVVLAVSLSSAPSVLPGVVNLGLGDSFAQILLLPPQVADAAQGRTVASLYVPPGFTGTTVYFQSVSIPPGSAPPFDVSNLAATLIFF